MNCGEWEERLALYAAGDLPPGEAVLAERHLGECAGCQVFLSGLKQGLESLQAAHAEPINPAHFAAVRARVLAQLERERRPFWRRAWVYGFAVAGAALVVLLAVRSGPRANVPTPAIVSVVSRPPAAVEQPPAIEPPPAPRPQRSPRPKAESGDPVLIKMVSDNPDVVIYWIANSRGD